MVYVDSPLWPNEFTALVINNPPYVCVNGLLYIADWATLTPSVFALQTCTQGVVAGNLRGIGYWVSDTGQAYINTTTSLPSPDPDAVEAGTLPAVKPLPLTSTEPIPVEATFPQPNIDGEAYTDPSTGNRVKTRYLVEPGPGLASLANGGQIAPPTVNVTETTVSASAEYPPKNNGGCNAGVPNEGNPINASIGNKWQHEVDIESVAAPGFARMYNSNPATGNTNLGNGWTHTYSRSISLQPVGSGIRVSLQDGKSYAFNTIAGGWAADADIPDQLVEIKDANAVRTGWRYTIAADDSVETYSTSGKLLSIADRTGRTQTLVYDLPFTSGGDDDPETLDSVTDDTGRQLVFTYDEQKRISTLTDPLGGSTSYGYDAQNNLISVTFPDGSGKTYHYNEPEHTAGADLPHALTGITDENGDRYAIFTYDANGKAISTGHAGGADLFTMSYNGDVSTTVTDPLGAQRTHNLTTILGVVKSTGQSQPGGSGCGPAASAMTYDANGNIASYTDFNGNQTTYVYDLARNLETSRTEGLTATGAATPQSRTTTTEWHLVFRLPVKITEPGRETIIAYDSHGNVTQSTMKDIATNATRTWATTYTYHASIPGVLVQKVMDGPRTDVADLTTIDYYAPDASCMGGHFGCRGQVRQITNALGHVTLYGEYDPNGRITQMTDPNGGVTTMTYTSRGWLASRSLDGKTTTYNYTPWGGLSQVTYPDATSISYIYDPAHRLTSITDSANRQVSYTLDAMGNRIQETYTNPDASQARELHRIFDTLGRLKDEVEGVSTQLPRTYGYYANGELKSMTSPKGDITSEEIDALGRSVKQIDPVNGSAKPTLMRYDGLDRLIELTAPNGATTTFDTDGLGNLKQETSTDRGVLNGTYDEAGNRKTLQDARGLTLSYQYDALDRLTRIDAPASGGLAASTTLLTWDNAPGCSHGIGRLCQVSHAGVTTTYDYDSRGNRIKTTRVEDGETFVTINAFNDADRPVDIITPSFETVVPTLDLGGRIQDLASTGGGVTTQLAQNIQYAATGRILRQTLGQTLIEQSLDTAGRLGSETATVEGTPPDSGSAPVDGDVPLPAWALWLLGVGLAGTIAKRRAATANLAIVACGLVLALSNPTPTYAADLDLAYDPNGNISSKTTPSGTTSFTYDKIDRIDTETGPAGTRDHDFDAGGNRITDGAGTTASFTPNTDRIATINGISVTLDASGNLTSDGTYKYLWNGLGQLAELRKPDNTLIASYYYDHQNLRTRKVATAAAPQGASKTFYHYDQADHLIAETTPGNQPQATYIWNGDTLTGLIVPQPQRAVYTVQTDHLGSPFQVRTLAGQVVWRWDSEAFGKTLPNEDVDGDGINLTLNLRFPGQYFDRESGLHYNWNRYYSPKLGRYLSPDLIGLDGGANLFAYVGGNPLSHTDPKGLDIYVANTEAVGGLHQKIIVDTPNGQYGQSFGMSSSRLPQQGILEAYGVNPQKDLAGSGVVYSDSDPITKIQKQFKTTPAEDALIEKYLRDQLGNTGPYNVASNSCRNYSNRQYDIIVNAIKKRRGGK